MQMLVGVPSAHVGAAKSFDGRGHQLSVGHVQLGHLVRQRFLEPLS